MPLWQSVSEGSEAGRVSDGYLVPGERSKKQEIIIITAGKYICAIYALVSPPCEIERYQKT